MRMFARGGWHGRCSQRARMNEQDDENVGGGTRLTEEQRAHLKDAARNVDSARLIAAWDELREEHARRSAKLE